MGASRHTATGRLATLILAARWTAEQGVMHSIVLNSEHFVALQAR